MPESFLIPQYAEGDTIEIREMRLAGKGTYRDIKKAETGEMRNRQKKKNRIIILNKKRMYVHVSLIAKRKYYESCIGGGRQLGRENSWKRMEREETTSRAK